jgi:hypothetical protein
MLNKEEDLALANVGLVNNVLNFSGEVVQTKSVLGRNFQRFLVNLHGLNAILG